MNNQNAVQKYGITGIADVLACFGVPTGTAMQIYQDVLGKRGQDGLEILLAEIRNGTLENIDQHDAVSITARFLRDAMEGVARNNLRLMARVINGMAEKQELKAPTFLKYANILSSLTEEEITVLGIMVGYARSPNQMGLRPGPKESNLDRYIPEKEALKKAVPNYGAVQQALIRTGLLFFRVDSQTGEDFSLDMGNVTNPNSGHFKMDLYSKVEYELTPLMYEISRYLPETTVEDQP